MQNQKRFGNAIIYLITMEIFVTEIVHDIIHLLIAID